MTWMFWALQLRGLTPLARIVAINLAGLLGNDDVGLNSPVAYYASVCDVSEPEVMEALEELAAKGHVSTFSHPPRVAIRFNRESS